MEDIDGDFRIIEDDSSLINDGLAASNDDVALFFLDYPSTKKFRLSLVGSSSPNLYIEANNCEFTDGNT